MIEKGASDMHITTGSPPVLRIDGQVVPLKLTPLGPVETKQLCYSILTEEQKIQFEKTSELDLSFGVKSLSRFRANIFMQRGAVAGAFRTIPFKITTLAAMIDKINSEQRCHIVTIEDPIEYLHPHKLSIVNQREVGTDTEGFKIALKYVLRQDPDVVLVGEMRDLETIEAALTISETGHLVFATLHTNSAVSTINRIIDAFPPHQQDQIRAKVSFVLQGVISQQLVPRMGQPGRCMALEVMLPNAAIRNLIREGKIHQVYTQMQMGQDKYGMQTLNQSLFSLYKNRLVSLEEAMGRSVEPEEFRTMIDSDAKRTSSHGSGAHRMPSPR
jgi:twitching motility protein PilT